MKTADLEGPALEYWFRQATGTWTQEHGALTLYEYVEYGGMPEMFGWSDIGPIIERERICIVNYDEGWAAYQGGDTFIDTSYGEAVAGVCGCAGPAPLVAAMRCVVLVKFGAEVES